MLVTKVSGKNNSLKGIKTSTIIQIMCHHNQRQVFHNLVFFSAFLSFFAILTTFWHFLTIFDEIEGLEPIERHQNLYPNPNYVPPQPKVNFCKIFNASRIKGMYLRKLLKLFFAHIISTQVSKGAIFHCFKFYFAQLE